MNPNPTEITNGRSGYTCTMGLTLDLGRRIELVSMDSHFHEISIALYRRTDGPAPAFLVHTYASRDGAAERMAAIARAMAVLGGVESDGLEVRFSCGQGHERACRRLFLESCKQDPAVAAESKPLTIFDRKTQSTLTLESLGAGAYRFAGGNGDPRLAKRRIAVGAGLVKLAEMKWTGEREDCVAFPCEQSHDELVGLLLSRALNVRGVEREQQLAAARGQLLAPSAQKR